MNSKSKGFSAPIFQALFPNNLLKILMGDVQSPHHFDSLTEIATNPKANVHTHLDINGSPEQETVIAVDDPEKLVLLYFQAHTLAKYRNKAPFNLHFYDDRADILFRVQQHFSQHPELLPRNCTLMLNAYNPNNPEFSKNTFILGTIQGTGPVQDNIDLAALTEKNLDWNRRAGDRRVVELLNLAAPDFVDTPQFLNLLMEKQKELSAEIQTRIDAVGKMSKLESFSTLALNSLKAHLKPSLENIKTQISPESPKLPTSGLFSAWDSKAKALLPISAKILENCSAAPEHIRENLAGCMLLNLNDTNQSRAATTLKLLERISAKTPVEKQSELIALWQEESQALRSQNDDQIAAFISRWKARERLQEQADFLGVPLPKFGSYADTDSNGTNNLATNLQTANTKRVMFNRIKSGFAGLSALVGTGGMIASGILATGFLFGTGGIGALVVVFLALLILAPLMVLIRDVKEQKERGLNYLSANSLQTQPTVNAVTEQTAPTPVPTVSGPAAPELPTGALTQDLSTSETAAVFFNKIRENATNHQQQTGVSHDATP